MIDIQAYRQHIGYFNQCFKNFRGPKSKTLYDAEYLPKKNYSSKQQQYTPLISRKLFKRKKKVEDYTITPQNQNYVDEYVDFNYDNCYFNETTKS